MMTGLSAYTPTAQKPWNKERIIHLYRRMGMGPTPAQVADGLTRNPSDLVDSLIAATASMPSPTRPYWAGFTWDDYENEGENALYEHRDDLRRTWYRDMVDNGLRAKLTVFWHNHFVTQLEVYGCNNYLWSYFELLHRHCLGNFRTFVEEMGLTPAMLVYLNGNQNIKQQPNENYARELMELFTMGESNGYTQADVVEMARSLTGWRCNMYECETPYFEPFYHDYSQKTIFGYAGNWGYDDVHELIFTHRSQQVSTYICTKLYKYFVYNKPDEAVIAEMAAIFRQSGWQLQPVLSALFKSDHFFDDRFMGAHVDSPLQLFTRWVRSAGLNFSEVGDNEWIFRWGSYDLGMDLFDPVDVAGWPGHHAWMNENTLTQRIKFLQYLSYRLYEEPFRIRLQEFALGLVTATNDPLEATRELCRHFLGRVPEPAILDAALFYFKGDVPQNYYDDGSWNLYWESTPYQIINLLFYLTRIPESQLS